MNHTSLGNTPRTLGSRIDCSQPVTRSRTVAETLSDAFRAAFLLTGRADSAEDAVSQGIMALESCDDIEKALVAKTVEFVYRQRMSFPNRLEHAMARLPLELQRLIWLSPVSRDCFILRILFGISAAKCASILNLTIEQFAVSLRAALLQLPMAGPQTCWSRPFQQEEEAPK